MYINSSQQPCTPLHFTNVFLRLLADMELDFKKEQNEQRRLKLIKYHTLIAIGGYFGPKTFDLLNTSWSEIIDKNTEDNFMLPSENNRKVFFSQVFLKLAKRNYRLIKPGNIDYLILHREHNPKMAVSPNQFNKALKMYFSRYQVTIANASSVTLRKTHFQYVWQLHGGDYNAYGEIKKILNMKAADRVRDYLGHTQKLSPPETYRIE